MIKVTWQVVSRQFTERWWNSQLILQDRNLSCHISGLHLKFKSSVGANSPNVIPVFYSLLLNDRHLLLPQDRLSSIHLTGALGFRHRDCLGHHFRQFHLKFKAKTSKPYLSRILGKIKARWFVFSWRLSGCCKKITFIIIPSISKILLKNEIIVLLVLLAHYTHA